MKVIFSKHAEQRINERAIEKQNVFDALFSSDKLVKRFEKFYAQKKFSKGIIEVVFERKEDHLIIITVYWL